MSIFDQDGEQYETATANTPEYNHIGCFPEITSLTTYGVEVSTDDQGWTH